MVRPVIGSTGWGTALNADLDGIEALAIAPLTSSNNHLAADVTMTTAGTQYDGPTLTLAAGTWLIVGALQVLAATSASRTISARIWDGAIVHTAGIYQVTGTASAGQASIPMGALVTPASSTTYTIQCTSTVNSDIIRGTSTKGSYLLAVKIG